MIGVSKGWVTLRLNFRLKGYVSRQYLWTVAWRMVIRYYNCAAGSFHTKKLYSRLYSIEIEFYFLNRFLSHPFGDLGLTTHSIYVLMYDS